MSNIDSRQEKDQEIIKVSAQFVHDISTPLAIIQILAGTLETYLPGILSAHQQLKKQGVEVVDIPSEQYAALENSATRIKALTQEVNRAARDYWHQLNQQIEPAADEADNPQDLNATVSISLENSLDILVVEDDAIHQKIALKILSNQHQVDIAANGREAVEACRQKTYDLILMDLHMPVMDGRQAVAEITQLTDSPPVIVGLTNRPLGSEKKELFQLGFNGFIEKPLNLVELTRIIEELGLVHG